MKKTILAIFILLSSLLLVSCNDKSFRVRIMGKDREELNVIYVKENQTIDKSDLNYYTTDDDFLYWSLELDGSKFDLETKITSNITLFAVFQKEIVEEKVIINFFVDDKVYLKEEIIKGNKVDKPKDPTKEGFEFIAWALKSNQESIFDFNSIINNNTDLVATFKEIQATDEEIVLTHLYDFSSLDILGEYTKTERFVEVDNISEDKIDSLSFTTLSTAVQGHAESLNGFVLGIRSNNQYMNPYIKTNSAIKDLTKIEFNYTLWGNDDINSAKSINIQISKDGINWETVKDIRDEVNGEFLFTHTAEVELEKTTAYIRIYIEHSGLQKSSFRFIITSLSLYTVGEPYTGKTHNVLFDYGENNYTKNHLDFVREGKQAREPKRAFLLANDFLGWFEEGSDIPFDFNSTITEDVELYAKWKERVYDPLNNPSNTDNNIISYYNTLSEIGTASFKEELKALISGYNVNNLRGSTFDVKDIDTYNNGYFTIYDSFERYGDREHVWPQSFLIGAGLPKDDLHNLRAAVAKTNNARGTTPFGSANNSGHWNINDESFYPGDEHIGDVARIILFVYLRYDLPIEQVGNIELFVKWHEMDPVDDFERMRNNNIFKKQKDRNPFIDYPEYVEAYFS